MSDWISIKVSHSMEPKHADKIGVTEQTNKVMITGHTDEIEECEESESDEEDDITIDWESTLVTPEACLITEEKFRLLSNELSFMEYFESITKRIEIANRSAVKNISEPTWSTEIDNLIVSTPQKETNESESGEIRENDAIEGDYTLMEDRQESDIFENRFHKNKWESHQTAFSERTMYHRKYPQPRISNITVKDLKFYSWYMKLTIKGGKNEKNMLAKKKQHFLNLTKRVLEEQNEYQEFLSKAAQHNPEEYIYLNPLIAQNAKECWIRQVNKAVQENKGKLKLVSAHDNIGNLASQTKFPDVQFKFLKTVREQVQKCLLVLPPIEKALTTDSEFVVHHPQDKMVTGESEILQLLESENAHIYIPHSSFLSIIESMSVYSSDCFIPFRIKELDPLKKKVVILEIPLPRTSMTSREASYNYYKSKLIEAINDSEYNHDSVSLNLFCSGDLNIMVESSEDGYKETNGKTESYKICPKIEFQPNIGMEKFSMLDLCRYWWDSMIANTDNICCVRIDPRNDFILRDEKYTRDQFCGPGCPYNPQTSMRHISAIFHELIKLPCGKYVLECSMETATETLRNLNIFIFSEDGQSIIENRYKNIISGEPEFIKEFALPWLPIDMNILPKQCLNNSSIPWLFEVVRYSWNREDIEKRKRRNNRRRRADDSIEYF